MTLRVVNVDKLVSTLTRRDHHQRDRLVTLRREKQRFFSENPTHEAVGRSTNASRPSLTLLQCCFVSPVCRVP